MICFTNLCSRVACSQEQVGTEEKYEDSVLQHSTKVQLHNGVLRQKFTYTGDLRRIQMKYICLTNAKSLPISLFVGTMLQVKKIKQNLIIFLVTLSCEGFKEMQEDSPSSIHKVY